VVKEKKKSKKDESEEIGKKLQKLKK